MSAAAFLLLAFGFSIAGSLLIWVLNRKPKTFMSSIDDFSREMKALGREPEVPAGGRRRKRPAPPPARGPAPKGEGEGEADWLPDPNEERRP